MTLLQKAATVAGSVASITAAIIYCAPYANAVVHEIKMATSTMDTLRSIRYEMSDAHGIALQAYKDQFKLQKEVDSLSRLIILLEKGKHPYDSLWVKSRSGHYIKSTLLHEEEFRRDN